MKKKIWEINGKMPIGAYHGPMCETALWKGYPNHIIDESYALAKEGGFNFMISFAERYPAYKEQVLNALNFADKNGLKIMVSDANIEQQVIERREFEDGVRPDYRAEYAQSLQDYGNHPAFFGCFILDEPLTDRFPLTRELKDVFEEMTPDKLFFVNLLPIYGISPLKNVEWIYSSAERAETYDGYVRDYLEMVDPPVFCYDYYPFGQEFPFTSCDYLLNLKIVSDRCKERGIPFWVSPQAYANKDGDNIGIRQLTQGEEMYQIGSALCYGAKGFAYYCWEAYSDYFDMALVDKTTNQPTPLFYVAQRGNCWIDKVSDYLLKADHIRVIRVGESLVSLAETEAEELEELKQIRARHLLVGLFNNNGKDIYYLFNNSIVDSDRVFGELPKGKKFLLIDENSEREIEGKFEIMLDIGCSVLIVEK